MDKPIDRIYPCVYKHLNLEFPFEEKGYDNYIRSQLPAERKPSPNKKK